MMIYVWFIVRECKDDPDHCLIDDHSHQYVAGFLNNTNHSKQRLQYNVAQLGIYTRQGKEMVVFFSNCILLTFMVYMYAQEMNVFMSNIRFRYAT